MQHLEKKISLLYQKIGVNTLFDRNNAPTEYWIKLGRLLNLLEQERLALHLQTGDDISYNSKEKIISSSKSFTIEIVKVSPFPS